MFSHPWSYAELGAAVAVVLVTSAVAAIAAGALAHRKGYDPGLWAFAGATLIGFAGLAFLPSVDDARTVGAQRRRRLAGNRVGGCFAGIWLIALAASFATNPDEDDLKQFVRNELPLSRDEGVARVMAGASEWGSQVTRQDRGLFSTGTVRVSGHGSVKVIGFWGGWRAAARGD